MNAGLAFRCIAFLSLAGVACSASAQGAAAGIISDRVGSQITGGQAGSIFGRLVKLDLAISQTKGQILRAEFQPANAIYLQQFANGVLLVWDFERGAQVDEFRLSEGAVPVYYDLSAARLFVLDGGHLLRVARSKDGTLSSERVFPDAVAVATASGDGRWLLAGTRNGEVVKLNGSGAIAWRTKHPDPEIRAIRSSEDGTRLTVLGASGVARVLDVSGGGLATIPNVARLGSYGGNGRQVHLTRNQDLIFVGSDGTSSSRRSLVNGTVESLSMSARGDRVMVVSSDGKLSVGDERKWDRVEPAVKYAAFLGDRKYLSIRNDGVTYLKSLDVDYYLVAIVPGSAGWVIVDHEGRYDGTVEGVKDVRWSAESGGLSLDQFFDSYYQPGLLSAYVKDQTLGALPGKVREGVFLPPKLELDFPDGKMKPGTEFKVVAVAESKGGDLTEEIKVFHNGKRLPSKSRIGSQKVQRDGRLLLIQVFAFVPESGPNEVFAEIRNSHGITGRSEIKREIAPGNRPPGKLQILGVGIDKYQNSKIDLDFASIDVKSVVGNMTAGAKPKYEKIQPQLLLDRDATNSGIKGLLDRLSSLEPSDTLILVLAGHGDMHEGEWYFLPHDVDLQNISKTAISVRELQDALVNSPVKRIFLMVDACNSGAGIDSFNRYRAFQRRFVQQVGRNAGVSVLTATRRDQLAAEVGQLGHGLFTHVILEGLAGAADTAPKDGSISAHELANFVGQNLEQRARQFLEVLGLAQSPAHFVIGSDFLISSVSR